MRQGKGQGRAFGNRKMTNSQVCVCSICGYTISHVSGIPCRSKMCPICKIPLLRNGEYQERSNHNEDSLEKGKSEKNQKNKKSKSIDCPEVDQERCIGCGNCIDVCSMDAISIEKGKAVIDPEKCANCRACESACPVNAIY
jgi:Na+-translocating ferredoxin:NAD+ oxidoreductase subunit B